MDRDNLFRLAAEFYDLDTRDIVKDDIAFYLEHAQEKGGSILELACGTGRITIPLARAGCDIWGIDLSQNMLEKLQDKLNSGENADLKKNLHIVHGDMCSFELDRKFSMIFIPFRSFQCLLTKEQCDACLTGVYNHLCGDGIFIINVFRPYKRLDASWIRPETPNWETTDPVTGMRVRRTEVRRSIDVEKQIIYPELIYYIQNEDGSEERIVEELKLKYYYEEQMRELLLANGFKIEEEMGYYDGRPISEGPELIFICKK